MNRWKQVMGMIVASLLVLSIGGEGLWGQSKVLRTPLKQELLTLLTNEISGQMIFNNEVLLAGAPWVRDGEEFTDTFYESGKIYEMVGKYGIETTRLERYNGRGNITYPFEGEFWLTSPEKRLVARIGADAALVAGGSVTADVTGELIYLPPLSNNEIKALAEAKDKYAGKIALMWSHARGNLATALDAAGVQAVISFSSRDRYQDPDQIVYSSGSYGGHENLKIGFTVSWRQWSELMEDAEAGRKLTVRCMTRMETFSNKYETVFSWIPGTEPDKKGIIFSAHLFEGYTKRGANDNMSGCVIQLEILRVLDKLIKTGQLPQPRRNIYFLWPNEISGTNEFFNQNPGFTDKLSANLNMDMCGEGLRLNNGVVEITENPDNLPCYTDGLLKSIANYIWRTNDIVYLPDSPRGRSGGQYFPIPMVEKNGSYDAFRFFMHRATGGSDHTCFWRVSVPGTYIGVWPDNWYHADTDTPDKSDPTQMKRIAFLGAAAAWAAANCTDQVLPVLLDVTSEYGFARIAERELVEALSLIESATFENLPAQSEKALALAQAGVEREKGAIISTEDIYTGSIEARDMVDEHIEQWKLYGESLKQMLQSYAELKARQLKLTGKNQWF